MHLCDVSRINGEQQFNKFSSQFSVGHTKITVHLIHIANKSVATINVNKIIITNNYVPPPLLISSLNHLFSTELLPTYLDIIYWPLFEIEISRNAKTKNMNECARSFSVWWLLLFTISLSFVPEKEVTNWKKHRPTTYFVRNPFVSSYYYTCT